MVDSVYEDSRREVLIDGEPELAGYSRTRNCFALVDIACSLSEPVADALFRVSDSDEADFLTGNADSSEVGCAFGQRGRSDGCLEVELHRIVGRDDSKIAGGDGFCTGGDCQGYKGET